MAHRQCKVWQPCKAIARNDVIDNFISKDMLKILLRSRMWLRMNFTSGVFFSKTLLSIRLVSAVNLIAFNNLIALFN